jgi:regulator of protease activity HflC (stomatin/prohibitin superfamily)
MGGVIQFLVTAGLIILAVILVAQTAIKILKEYERGVIFRLGRLQKVKGPGLFFIIPFVDRMIKVDLRVITLDIPTQEAITKDNVTVKVNAVTFFRVVDPGRAIVAVEDYRRATWQISQTTLRSVLGQSDLDELLIHREEINQKLQMIIDEQTEPWGIKVGIVEVKDVELPDTLKRAMSAQAEAEREKRAKIINAEGELVAAQQLTEAAETMAREPMALQLRYLQTLITISAEKNSTILFPVPIDFLNAFSALAKSASLGSGKPSDKA